MARPRRNDHNRELLIETGLELLAKQGYHGTGLKQILDTVSVPKGSFYHYFESKEHFVAAVIDHYREQIMQRLLLLQASTPQQPAVVIEQIVVQGAQLYRQNQCDKGCLVGSLAAELGSQNRHCHEAMQRFWHEFDQWLAALIDEGKASAVITSSLPSLQLARLFWDSWQGGLIRMQLQGNTKQLNQQMELVLTQLFGIKLQHQGDAA
ncbi:TetR/AcrR family transcriptional regulator [Ferrimonas lipolytica]|uniref:TetR/AcrR family transcriptional regulator n=1 Tax=Ferrimonas lipolytica TaxID=2724191 RepID=A0A6H1UDK1_9GAMM|nr:TetR/AcrR family transcriptional regulator [Ferrimonas lipolytica]QIZ76918.1 TetR/AcrR family transcriptional regulator [Ferrimonas lipolytica]